MCLNSTKEFIIYKDEELLKVYSRKCDHNEGMRVSEEFTSSLQVAKTSKHKGFSADYYSHSIVAGGLLEIS